MRNVIGAFLRVMAWSFLIAVPFLLFINPTWAFACAIFSLGFWGLYWGCFWERKRRVDRRFLNLKFSKHGLRMLDDIRNRNDLKTDIEAINFALEATSYLDDDESSDKKAAEMTDEEFAEEWERFVDDPEDEPPKEERR